MALLDMKTDSSSFPSSSSAAVRWNYDVFLSFRGKDTRYNFVGHLYEALIQKGIHIFKDDINLDRGRPILPELLKAIGESRFAIVIISEDYASSDSCLVELAHIIHCKKEMGMTILPVFHHVDPSNIRKQLGTFEQAFIEHEKKENKETVEKWRDALREVGSLSGWHLKEYCSEIENIKDIVGCISLHLKYDALPYIAKDLVGINSRMEEFESHLALGSNDVRFIGIWGMGGMGKTTLARVVYYMVSIKFEACSFIEDVRERSERDGLVTLQQDLISDILKGTDLKIRDKYDGVINIRNRLRCKRILLVLDDVDKLDQLKFLVGEHDWFGPGSRIIITTRDEHVLKTHEVNEIYEVDGLNDEHALRLFSSKAFKGKHVPNDYLELSKHFLNYARGLPLALEVLGSFLNGKSIAEWKSALERLKDFPERIILQALKISFDGLRDAEKEIFLHIACFLNHKEKDHVLEVLDSLGLHPVIGLKELIDKSLLKITYMHIVWMHDLLEEMGKDIVRNECLNDPGKRSRLWCYKDIESVLKKNKGMKAVQAMHILCNYDKDEHEVKETCWSPEAISQMYNLKFLRIYGIFQDPQHLPNSLRVLCWSYYPSNSLPSTFQPDELVMLCLPHSRNEQLCIGIKNFDKLKIIDLSSSGFIISPDFTGVPNLEKLNLSSCQKLRELHPSVGILKKLVHFDLKFCENLVCLPNTICSLNSLERLDLCGCSNFDNLPENLGNLKGLKMLYLSGTAIKELPSSIDGLTTLTSLTLNDCKNLVCLPSTICSLKLLERLDLSRCSNFDNLPENLGNLKGLEELYLSGTAIKELPSSIDGLTTLTSLTLNDCKNLVCLPSSLNSLERLDFCGRSNFDNLPENLGNLKGLKNLHLSGTAIKELPSSIDGLTTLTSLTLNDCKNLVCLPSTICSLKLLECLDLYGCSNFDNLPENLGNLKGLKNLHLSGTAIKELPSSIDGLTTLTSLTLNDCKNLVCLPSIICSLNSLERLDLYGCSNFDNLPENLGNLKGLKNLHLSGTAIKELPSSIDGLTTLTSLTLNDCKNLVCLPSTICSLNSLERLDLCGCSNFDNLLENLGNLNGLKNLHLSGTAIKELPSSIDGLTTLTSLTLWSCRNLVCLPNTICCLISLECLEISGCSSFEYLPENLGNVKGLKKLGLSGSAIKELPSSIERLMHLTSLNLLDCFNLGCLPNTTCGFKFHGTLDLSTCSRFKNLPEMPWIIEGLLMLDLSNTVIEEMPSSIGRLTDLTALTLRFCMNLVRLPSTICSWKSLESLDLLGCLKFKNLPKNIGNMKDLEVLNLCWTSIIEFPSSIVLLKNLKHLYIRGWKLSEFYSQSASLELMDPLWNLPFSQPTSPQECIGLPSFLYSSLPTSPVLVGLLLPSLSGLHSLTYLCINDCDLLSIPDDIGCLSSLECLNLSGNNFVSLPESMSQLFNLRRLYLEGCKRLQSLGNVLSTIDSVIANDCSSLERLPELQFYPFMSNHSLFQCFNCFKLVDYIQNGSNMLQGLPNIVIPGGEIPKWFSNEFQGDNIQLSFPGCDELMGIVLCVVFVPNGSHQYHRNWNFTCIFQLNGLKIADFSQSYYFTTKYGRIESPHIWLLYLSTHRSVSNWGKICSRIDANGFRQLKIQIFAEVVEKIGVQLVYKQDMEDPNQTMAQCISNNSTLYEDFGVVHHDIDNSPIESSRNKQSRDVDDGAGPSGEGYSNEEPQPKWIQGEIFDYFAMEGGDQISKKLESIHGGKEDIYQDIEDPNQTLTQLSINSRKLYEELGDLSHDSYNSAAEGSRIKRRLDEEDGAGPSGEGYSNNEPHPKTRRMYG
ncbi:disease resistance protein RPV1-like isoform X23 [Quercus robur]|uniref:disease resistance protein RPV1-like isoform X22 n=1 Tax=Quercus robur TaxID=38942 RepID=UPI00216180BD|nr:disease resistance protein RPV1-like isoform X22 [Quercus robur]XP_050257402.1 disease resistance protein RPV1-like isoform X23 [Quercus robur]